MTDLTPLRRALLSVSDKTGLVPFATALSARGVALISTGGTAKALRDAGLEVTDVSEITGMPEMLDGRVKTLHPKIHGGLLGKRGDAGHAAQMSDHAIAEIDLLVVNLYPFEAAVAAGADYDGCVENIDIGGPAMIRAAAKNHAAVCVVTDVADYDAMLAELSAHNGTTRLSFRAKLAADAYARTAAYDAAISAWMAKEVDDATPRRRAFAATLAQPLRYGENPHQSAAFYTDGSDRPGVATATQRQGKALSYNNINDTDAAFELVAEFAPEHGPACAIIKHANPCGVGRGASLVDAYQRAYDCDRVSAFGGIVALNQPLDRATAEAIMEIMTEVVIAPGADDDARAIFEKKPNLRLLTTNALPDPTLPGLYLKQVSGGYLVQDRDTGRITADDLKVVTKRPPDPREVADMLFAWNVAKHVKSNAIIYAKNLATVGIGAGQMSRVDSARIAARKADDMAALLALSESPAKGSVVASDAFFPFADGLMAAAEAGATAVIQPGGSMRDAEIIEAADGAGLAMVFTGQRHFRH
ncbi:MAG: bifunctional phosphoribosylaminoimidazolecarboxamide formyltransferase/IMP cyclohydrolase [Pseudomonadota bacterium]